MRFARIVITTGAPGNVERTPVTHSFQVIHAQRVDPGDVACARGADAQAPGLHFFSSENDKGRACCAALPNG